MDDTIAFLFVILVNAYLCQKVCVNFGIYVPEQDAEWESEELEAFYEYRQMGELFIRVTRFSHQFW